MSGRIEGQVAIITGSSSGIGEAIAHRLSAEGAVSVISSRSLDRAQETAEAIRDEGNRAFAVELDVCSQSAVDSVVEEVTAEFDSIDILINNAGMFQMSQVLEMSPEEWEECLDIMLSGSFRMSQAVGRHMRNAGSGQVINISSIYADVGSPVRAAYCAAKGGLNSFTRAFAVEMAEYGVQVNGLAPGFIDTGPPFRTEDEPPRTDEFPWPRTDRDDITEGQLNRRIPMGRRGHLEEIANCALFLAEGDHYLSGEILHADGGWLSFGWGSKGP